MQLKDILIASVKGGINTKDDFLFEDKIKEIASEISDYIFQDDSFNDYNVEIDNEIPAIQIARENQKPIAIQISRNSVVFFTGSVHYPEFWGESFYEHATVKLYDIVCEKVRSSHKRETTGIEIDFVIPFNEIEKTNSILFQRFGDKSLFSGRYSGPDNLGRFNLDTANKIDEKTNHFFSLNKRSENIVIASDFRFSSTEIKNVSEMHKMCFTQEYREWIEKLLLVMSDNFQDVNEQLLSGSDSNGG